MNLNFELASRYMASIPWLDDEISIEMLYHDVETVAYDELPSRGAILLNVLLDDEKWFLKGEVEGVYQICED
jgi:hypothetical protein